MAPDAVAVAIPIRRTHTSKITPEVAALEAKYGDRVASLDKDGDGNIDRTELLMFLDAVVRQEQQMKWLKVTLGVALGVLIVFALTVFGMVWAVVALSKDTQVSSGNVLVSKSSGAPLATRTAMFRMPLPDTWQATGAALQAVHNVTSLTIEEGDGSSTTYRVATVRLAPNVSATFITTDNTTFVADAEGVRFSKAGAPWQKHVHSDPTTKCRV